MTSLRVVLTHPAAKLPTRESTGAAGYDLYIPADLTIPPQCIIGVPLCIKIEIPPGTYGQIRDRSSLALRGLLTVGGVIDSDYRGDVKVLLHNASQLTMNFEKGDRIAQLILINISTPVVEEVKELSSTVRNEGGFGSTGK